MSLRRVGVLLGKELFQGPKNFIFVWAIVAPVVISLVVSLIFGTLFTEKPRLGIFDEDSSQLVAMSQETTSITTREYDNIADVKQAVANGSVDIGIVLPAGFDSSVKQGTETTLAAFIWGESLAKNRTILEVTLANLIREMAGQEPPVEIESTTLGGEVSIPWNERLLPLIVLMAVFLGGMFLPATSVVNEKEERTLTALLVTPTTAGDVFIAKGLVGIIFSLFMGVVILVLNQAFGTAPLLLVLVLALGAIMATALGLLLGAALKDITTLFAVWKFGGILLFGPAFIFMFPQIPEWIGRLFPTYYILQPVVEISQQGGGWGDIATNLFILIGLDILLILVVLLVLRKSERLTAAG
jgi:ABC-2 type transport system permease protein